MKTLHFNLKWILITGCCFLYSGLFAQAPGWEWARSFGGEFEDYSNSIQTDVDGNIYMTGYNAASSLTSGYFIAKFDSLGVIQWMKEDTTAPVYSVGKSMAIDNTGNIYVSGTFQDSITFDNITLTCDYESMFVTKYNSSGNVIWAKCICGHIFGYLTVDNDFNIYITGQYASSNYSDTIHFDSTLLYCYNNYNIFIAKLDSSGSTIWVRSAGGSEDDYVYSLTTGNAKDVYITGYFANYSMIFETDTLLGNNWLNNYFLAKYDSDGNFKWVRSAADNSNSWAAGLDVNCNTEGNILICGSYGGTIGFDSTFLSASNTNEFIAKYDTSGNVLWATRVGGVDNNMNYYSKIVTDVNSNVYIMGTFQDSILVIGTSVLTLSNSYENFFIAKYTSSGIPIWALNTHGGGNGYVGGITLDLSGNLYATGRYTGSTMIIGNDTLYNFSAEGDADIFLAKLSPNVNNVISNESENSINIYPNPSTGKINITNLPASGQVQIINSTGQTLKKIDFNGQSSLNITLSENGIYFVRVISGNEVVTKKVVVV
ncbi:MAG: T9SS type A sorting domain-containing protein [Bacteroidia bacterium]|nr:T9SS type A sorting domain-containing protein [Bacteroidia bacterium]